MLWTINHTFRVYLNFFLYKKKSSCWTFSFPVSLSHLGYNYYRWFSARGVCQLIWFPAIFMHLFIHFHRVRIVDDAFNFFLIAILSSILFWYVIVANWIYERNVQIVYIDEPFAYYLWTQRACSCFVLYCLDFWKHGS